MSRRGGEAEAPEDYPNSWHRAIDRGQSTDHDVRGVVRLQHLGDLSKFFQNRPALVRDARNVLLAGKVSCPE